MQSTQMRNCSTKIRYQQSDGKYKWKQMFTSSSILTLLQMFPNYLQMMENFSSLVVYNKYHSPTLRFLAYQ